MKSTLADPGFLDPSFAAGGLLIPDPSRTGGVRALAVDPQERLLYILQAEDKFLLFRSDPSGKEDTSFGTDGVVSDDFGAGLNSWAYQVLVQSDEKIVVVGEVKESFQKGQLAIARYDSNGVLDAQYGKRIISLPGDKEDSTRAPSAALDSDNCLFVAYNSSVHNGENRDTGWIVKISRTGELDLTFGAGTGYCPVRFADENTSLYAIGVQSGGRIIVAGAQSVQQSDDIVGNSAAIAGFTPDGQLDSSFGAGGEVISTMGNSTFYSMALDHDHIFAAGIAFEFQAMVTKLTPDALADNSFNGGRPHIVDDAPTSWYGIAVQPDGKVVLGGTVMLLRTQAIHARFQVDGMLDRGYGQQGLGHEGQGTVFSAAIQPDAQRIILAGSSLFSGAERPCLYGISI